MKKAVHLLWAHKRCRNASWKEILVATEKTQNQKTWFHTATSAGLHSGMS